MDRDRPPGQLFSEKTTAVVYGLQPAPVQRMLDFDFLCGRTPSVSAIINPGSKGVHKAFFGSKEILIPVYPSIFEACSHHPGSDVFIDFASQRSVLETTSLAVRQPSIRTIVIIAEGVPERHSVEIIALAGKFGKTVIGPATVGGIKAGRFRIGNTGGTIQNIVESGLHFPGSVGVVAKSGGLSNELYNIISRQADGVNEGISIGGDKYPGSLFLDHVLRFEKDPEIRMVVLLGELGSGDELEVARAIKEKRITKPVVAWVSGTCAALFPTEVQFGHAGAKSGDKHQSAQAKNTALRGAGAIVPNSFEDFGEKIGGVFKSLGIPKDRPHHPAPNLPPQDYDALAKEGKVRKPTGIVSGISDDRGEDVTYNKIPLSRLIEEGAGIGDVIGLLWFKRKLPSKASKFIELVLVTVADHGPAVSGAHNAIVASRAGKDVIASLCSGLLTIGPRFGGAIDDAARYFRKAVEEGKPAPAFVSEMKEKAILIPGIGHRVKSVQNPDRRVEQLKEYAAKNFSLHRHLDFALEVEGITTQKRANLILNVDGCVAACLLDMLEDIGLGKEEVDELLSIGAFNALFALGRSIGIIGHAIDQKRLKQALYRHDTGDILYL